MDRSRSDSPDTKGEHVISFSPKRSLQSIRRDELIHVANISIFSENDHRATSKGLKQYCHTILLYTPHVAKDSETCSPKVLNPNRIEYHSNNGFYADLRAADFPPPPIFQGEHTKLRREKAREESQSITVFRYRGGGIHRSVQMLIGSIYSMPVLPSPFVTPVYCTLMVDVYDELKATGNIPFLTFGSEIERQQPNHHEFEERNRCHSRPCRSVLER